MSMCECEWVCMCLCVCVRVCMYACVCVASNIYICLLEILPQVITLSDMSHICMITRVMSTRERVMAK